MKRSCSRFALTGGVALAALVSAAFANSAPAAGTNFKTEDGNVAKKGIGNIDAGHAEHAGGSSTIVLVLGQKATAKSPAAKKAAAMNPSQPPWPSGDRLADAWWLKPGCEEESDCSRVVGLTNGE